MGDVWEKLLKERGYKIQHTLGEGAYSKVKSAFSSRLGKDVAIKCINSRLAPTDFVEKFLPRELETLPLLRHHNIVRVYEILEASDGLVYIVMEAAENGDMLRFVQKRGALPEPELKRYFWQLCQAIKYCHSQNICHRDLKCENLLLDKDHKLLLTDFGFSKPMLFDTRGHVSLSQTFCGSAAYAAPEIIQGRPYDPRMHDMWSLGVILYIMSCGHMPFDDSNVKKMLKVQLRNQLRFPSRVSDHLSDHLKNLIRSLIQPDLTKRATMEKVMSHPFFDGYHPSAEASITFQTL
ncbi:testis-specific serine/threonine-protein kinase 1-like isoform X2 [Clavelina lepadiformis]|uniref:testis-specific serine/threonine-protein kinase 1-like isoform X2 n=1 Tax=Clavelina lepadiformis TaxID=159417 RepID=UPI004041BE76